MKKQLEIELKVGLFVTIGLGLIMLAILVLGSTQNLLSRQAHYTIYFPSVEGLIPGAKVILNGVNAGTVIDIDLDMPRRQVRVNVGIAQKYAQWLKKDSTAEVSTQGVLGDKLVVLNAGAPEAEILPNFSEIPSRTPKDLSQFLSKGDQLMGTLTSITNSMDHILKSFEFNNRNEAFFQGMAQSAKNLSLATEKINAQLDGGHLQGVSKNLESILSKINNGAGTLGQLVNDPGLYYDVKALFGGAQRNRILRNLVRQTVQGNEQDTNEPTPAAPAQK